MSEVETVPPYSTDGRGPRLRADFAPQRLLPSVMAGLIVGLMTILLALSFAALVFSADLAEQLPRAIGTTLFSAVVINLVVALGSSFRTAIAPIQDPVAAVLAVIVASIATHPDLHGPLEPVLPTVLAAIALTSLLTGAVFLALGVFRLGRMIRYIPYPVVGGFLAGAGWLVAHGSIAVLTDLHLDLNHLPELAHSNVLARLVPGVTLAVVLLILSRRGAHILAVPGTLVAATGLFYAAIWLSGSSVTEAAEGGWLLGPFHTEQLWQPLSVADLRRVNWHVLVDQAADIVALLVINAIALLLNSTELELVLRKDADLDRELRVAGVANVVAGAGGGMAGYLSLPLTHLGSKQGADSRVVGVAAALLAAVVLMFGASLLAYVPRIVLGGLLLFTGLELLVEWTYDAWHRLPRIVFDGFGPYVGAFRQVFRLAQPTGTRGRPRLIAWPDLALGQVVKHTLQRHVTHVERRIVHGTSSLVERLLQVTQDGGVLNTAYIERLNGMFRASFAPLVRRSRATARLTETLTVGMYLVGCVYNSCRCHESLAVELVLPHGRRWLKRTPAIAAGITDHVWSVHELLCFKIAPPPYPPSKRRGRPTKAQAYARSLFAEPPR